MQEIADNRRISVNKLINKALIQWMQSFSYGKKLKYLMLTKDMFKSLIQCADSAKIDELSNQMVMFFSDFFQNLINAPLKPENLEIFITHISAFLSDQGIRWFEEFEIVQVNDRLIVKGFHYLGAKFSEFFTLVFIKIMNKYFSYTSEENFQEFSLNSIYLEFFKLEKEKL